MMKDDIHLMINPQSIFVSTHYTVGPLILTCNNIKSVSLFTSIRSIQKRTHGQTHCTKFQ